MDPYIFITPGEDGSLATTVYRKPTHTDLYMQWDSHHAISSKYSVIGTLHHWANTICSSPELLQQEDEHLHSLNKMQVPCLGTQQGEDQNENTSPKKPQGEQ